MVEVRAMRDAVDAAFARAAAGLTGWADPFPDRDPPDDAYSRVTDPGRWRIMGVRAEAWVDATVGLGLARRDTTASWQKDPIQAISRTSRAAPHAPGALPLTVAHLRYEEHASVGVLIGAGDPAVVVELFPDCACDACDSGSRDALEDLDDHIEAVVTGQFRRLSNSKSEITLMGDRTKASNFPRGGLRLRQQLPAILADPSGWHDTNGTSWLTA